MNPGTLLVRADASVAIGSGHVMRCLALAQGWRQAGGEIVFAMAASTPGLERRLAQENFRVVRMSATPGSREDLAATQALLREESPSWIVLDGYSFDSAYRQATAQIDGSKCLIVDDNGDRECFSSDLVVNQNAHACAELYPQRGPHTRVLLGPRYAMLRKEFADHHDWLREIPEVGQKILVTMGGSDPTEFAPRLLPYLFDRLDRSTEICVVVGGSANYASAMVKHASSFLGRVLVLQDVRNMAELMAPADLAIAAAGTTSWEICCMGLPAIVVEAADNQRRLARKLDAMGVAVNAGPTQSVDCAALVECARDILQDGARRREMSEKAKGLVDGRGVDRILSFMSSELRVRLAEARDCRLLWEWANDPVVRAASFTAEPIAWEDHQRWFAQQIESPAARIYVIENEAGPVGQVRYQIKDGRATLSINVDPRVRGQGMGSKVLLLGVEELFNTTAVEAIDADVKLSNERSLELFRSAGFEEKGVRQERGQDAAWFVLKRWGDCD